MEHRNPHRIPRLYSAQLNRPEAHLGCFLLPAAAFDDIDWYSKVRIPSDAKLRMNARYFVGRDGDVYIPNNAFAGVWNQHEPQIGDLRLSYQAAIIPVHDATAIAVQTDDGLRGYVPADAGLAPGDWYSKSRWYGKGLVLLKPTRRDVDSMYGEVLTKLDKDLAKGYWIATGALTLGTILMDGAVATLVKACPFLGVIGYVVQSFGFYAVLVIVPALLLMARVLLVVGPPTPAPRRAFVGCFVLTALSIYFELYNYPVGGHLPTCGPQFVFADDICVPEGTKGTLRLPFFFLLACTVVSGVHAVIEIYQNCMFRASAKKELAQKRWRWHGHQVSLVAILSSPLRSFKDEKRSELL
jgi:hypothetical protein